METVSTLKDQKQVAVTIYNDNLALIKDQRQVHLTKGQNTLALRDVSAQIRPETALLRSLSSPGSLSVLEQNFDFDLLTPHKLLEKYTGKTVTIIRLNPATGAETSEQAQVLSTNEGLVFRIGNRIETGMPDRIVYDEVPENLRDRPTLVTQLENKGPTDHSIELSYLTSGLSWKADYVAELNAAESKLDLTGWVTLSNTSGAHYANAKLQLVAGDVNIVREQHLMEDMHAKSMTMAAAPQMRQESLLEYHLYTLDKPTTLAQNQTKQVSLLTATNVPVRKEYLLRGAEHYYQAAYDDLGQKMKIGVFLEFDNKETSQLGMPLPKGILRVYKKDSTGAAQFVGEDRIDHTPKNEIVRAKLGDAFDVTANKKQTDFKKLPSPEKGTSLYESAYEVVLKNARKEAVTVTVQEPIPGDWRMVSSSHTHKKATSRMAEWHIQVPAESQTTLTYRVQVKY
ncbi:MAG TPA: DUF4139 domain-containing protein [Methylophilaceae bacterium]|nr:DUF4139 domain-containing protein [Methylophilaceae bacterium]